jgi:N-acetylglucosaminyldiphosphoundecaprenol N-acetyl-beta-D-mannosaminyltransferase
LFPTILSSRIDPSSYPEAVAQIIHWTKRGESRSVYAANVHMVMEAYDSVKFRKVINTADLVTPDGMPLVWVLRWKGYSQQQRVYGPTLMLKLLAVAADEKIPVGFLGSTKNTLQILTEKMVTKFPGLMVEVKIAPPFRSVSQIEDQELVQQIKASGVKLLFVGLGCPKQENWIAAHHGKIKAVMVGVGAAFDFHAGTVRQAPHWMQKLGLEWLFRLIQEPKRLWKRYSLTNPRFIILIAWELLQERFGKRPIHLC